MLVLEKVSSFLEFSLIHLPKSSKIVKKSCKFSRGGESQKLQVAFSFDKNSIFCISEASFLFRKTRAAKKQKIHDISSKIRKTLENTLYFNEKTACITRLLAPGASWRASRASLQNTVKHERRACASQLLAKNSTFFNEHILGFLGPPGVHFGPPGASWGSF